MNTTKRNISPQNETKSGVALRYVPFRCHKKMLEHTTKFFTKQPNIERNHLDEDIGQKNQADSFKGLLVSNLRKKRILSGPFCVFSLSAFQSRRDRTQGETVAFKEYIKLNQRLFRPRLRKSNLWFSRRTSCNNKISRYY